MAMNSIGIVQQLLAELPSFRVDIPQGDVLAPAVSGWSVGEHISHVAIAAPYVVSQVRGPSSADPSLASAGPEFLTMLHGERIPRGPVRPPERTRNPRSDQAHLVEDLDLAERSIRALEPDVSKLLADPGLVRHPNPGFGGLTRMQWLSAMSIHQRHHLRIIADMLKKA
jgi:hypothetical protein